MADPGPLPADGRETVYDLAERRAAASLCWGSPPWLVLWGPYSRRFWAFPCFGVPPGTVASAPGRGELVRVMHQIEAAARAGQPCPPAALGRPRPAQRPSPPHTPVG